MKAATLSLLFAAAACAQAGQPALEGLSRIEQKFGPEFTERVFEMTGAGGDPQPNEWRVTAHDPVEKAMLHEFWIGGRRVTDEGLNDDFYPERLPKGFFKLSRLKVDSTNAFERAERMAREAKVGFDVINYKLHCREYSDEPVWTLTLLDSEEEIVGSVHLSGESAEVLRTVWIRRSGSGRAVVQDTALGYKIKAVSSGNPPLGSGLGSADVLTRESEFGIADEEPPPAPAEPIPQVTPETTPSEAEPAATIEPEAPPPDANAEIPEIRRLNDAQEKAFTPKPPQ
ncbi:MAG: hypothetical protein ACR2OZ_07505 [Verrucomicrobiales bacterium]